jgi:PAS domain S-box-containing protein
MLVAQENVLTLSAVLTRKVIMPVPLQVLILDSQSGHVEQIVNALRQADFDPRWQRIDTEPDYLDQLAADIDVIIADPSMSGFDGWLALQHLKDRVLDIPFIVVGDAIDEEAVEYVRQGASDYVHRDRLERLGQSVNAALQAKQLREQSRHSETVLKASEERYRALSDMGAEYAYSALLDPSGGLTFEWASDSFTQHTGFTLEEINARGGWAGLIHPDDLMTTQPRTKSLLAGHAEVSEFRIVTSGGGIRWIRDSARPVSNEGAGVRIYGMAHDITGDKRATEELQRINAELEEYLYERTAELHRQQTLLQTILDSMGEGVLYSKGASIRYANRALAELTGYRTEDLIEQPNSILKSENASEEEARLFSDEIAELGPTWRGETRLRRKDGTEFHAALTVTLMTQAKGEIIGVVTIIRDITAEKQLQEQKTRFIANASHELRTPLTNIKTRIWLMRKQPERMNERGLALERAADRMTELIEDLLDVTRFERGMIRLNREDVILQKLIVDVVDAQQPEAARKRISVTTDLPSDVVQASIDQKRILQVITNLVTNAINYTPEDGQVAVRLLMDADRCAVIRVQDTGIGIAPDNLSHVFEPFFRVNENAGRGTGLGLSISKEIIALHGGTLEVESKLGAGSTFTIRLPRE